MNSKNNLIPLRIGGVPEHFNLPWRLAIESGALKKDNIDATWEDFHSGTGEMVRALSNDEVDIATLLTEGAVSALARDPKNAEQFELFSFYTKTPLVWGVHIPAQSDIKSLADIESATFAISRYGSGSHLMAYLLAESLELDTRKLSFKIIDNLDGARQLFNKDGNYIFLWEKFMTKPFVDSGEMKRIADFPTPWSCFVTCVRKSILKKYPKQIYRIMQSVLDTANDLKESAIASTLIVSQYQLELDDVETWLASTEWHKKIALDEALIKKVRNKLKALGII